MGRKLLTTPRSRIRAMIRQTWLRSRERAKALKDAKYRCNRCDIKQSTAKGKEVKLNVHHVHGITDWDIIIDLIVEKILAVELEVLCVSCHDEEHKKAKEDYTGQKFNKLTVVEFVERKKGYMYWLFACDCGGTRVARIDHVRSGDTKSCGCLINTDKITHGETDSRLYSIYGHMKARCLNKKDKAYVRYGGRGITICDEWCNNFIVFRDWALANGYSDELTIDRQDNNGNYEPSNCRWATNIEQSNNRRSNRLITYKGTTLNVAQWAEKQGISRAALYARLRRGMPIGRALTLEQRPNKKKKK